MPVGRECSDGHDGISALQQFLIEKQRVAEDERQGSDGDSDNDGSYVNKTSTGRLTHRTTHQNSIYDIDFTRHEIDSLDDHNHRLQDEVRQLQTRMELLEERRDEAQTATERKGHRLKNVFVAAKIMGHHGAVDHEVSPSSQVRPSAVIDDAFTKQTSKAGEDFKSVVKKAVREYGEKRDADIEELQQELNEARDYIDEVYYSFEEAEETAEVVQGDVTLLEQEVDILHTEVDDARKGEAHENTLRESMKNELSELQEQLTASRTAKMLVDGEDWSSEDDKVSPLASDMVKMSSTSSVKKKSSSRRSPTSPSSLKVMSVRSGGMMPMKSTKSGGADEVIKEVEEQRDHGKLEAELARSELRVETEHVEELEGLLQAHALKGRWKRAFVASTAGGKTEGEVEELSEQLERARSEHIDSAEEASHAREEALVWQQEVDRLKTFLAKHAAGQHDNEALFKEAAQARDDAAARQAELERLEGLHSETQQELRTLRIETLEESDRKSQATRLKKLQEEVDQLQADEVVQLQETLAKQAAQQQIDSEELARFAAEGTEIASTRDELRAEMIVAETAGQSEQKIAEELTQTRSRLIVEEGVAATAKEALVSVNSEMVAQRQSSEEQHEKTERLCVELRQFAKAKGGALEEFQEQEVHTRKESTIAGEHREFADESKFEIVQLTDKLLAMHTRKEELEEELVHHEGAHFDDLGDGRSTLSTLSHVPSSTSSFLGSASSRSVNKILARRKARDRLKPVEFEVLGPEKTEARIKSLRKEIAKLEQDMESEDVGHRTHGRTDAGAPLASEGWKDLQNTLNWAKSKTKESLGDIATTAGKPEELMTAKIHRTTSRNHQQEAQSTNSRGSTSCGSAFSNVSSVKFGKEEKGEHVHEISPLDASAHTRALRDRMQKRKSRAVVPQFSEKPGGAQSGPTDRD